MPHVTDKMHAGRSAADEQAMARAVASALADTMGYERENVSVPSRTSRRTTG